MSLDMMYCVIVHTAKYIILQSRLPRSSNRVRNIKRDHTEARFLFERLFYNRRRRNKSKIKSVQYSAIGICTHFLD